MTKVTVTLLTAAGLLALAGCKSEVMQDRTYAEPQNDPGSHAAAPAARQPMPPAADQPVRASQSAPAPAPAPARTRANYRPMEGTYSNEGLADDAAPRRRSGRAAARNAGAPAGKGGVYVVKPGDTLGKIAYRHHISVKALRDANKLDPKRDKFLRAGQKLTIPGAKAAPGGAFCATPAKGGKKGPAARPANAPKLNADGTYTMVRGDTIPKVARKFGIRAKALQQANNLSDEETTKLQIGHKLVIPTGSDAQARTAPKSARTVKKAQAPKKAAPAAASEQAPAKAETETPPPPPAAENASVPAADPAAALPPATQVDSAAQSESSSFVRVGDAKTLDEFAARNNTTTAELLRLNPSLDPAAPLKSDDMLFVPKK